MMQAPREPVPEALRLAGKHPQRRIDPVGRRMQIWIKHHISAVDRILGDGIARKVERTAVASAALFARPVLGMDRTNARRKSARAYNDSIPHADRSGEYGSGNDGPSPSKREGTVDRETEPARS